MSTGILAKVGYSKLPPGSPLLSCRPRYELTPLRYVQAASPTTGRVNETSAIIRTTSGETKYITVDTILPVKVIIGQVCSLCHVANPLQYDLIYYPIPEDDLQASMSPDLKVKSKKKSRGVSPIRSLLGSSSSGSSENGSGSSSSLKLHPLWDRRRRQAMDSLDKKWNQHSVNILPSDVKRLECESSLDDQGYVPLKHMLELISKRRASYSGDERSGEGQEDLRDINTEYRDCVQQFTDGAWPCDVYKATKIAALAVCVEHGSADSSSANNKALKGWIKDALPPEYKKEKAAFNVATSLFTGLKANTSSPQARELYVQHCKKLETYQATFFVVKMASLQHKAVVPHILAISPVSVVQLNQKTQQVVESWLLDNIVDMMATELAFRLKFKSGVSLYAMTYQAEKIEAAVTHHVKKRQALRESGKLSYPTSDELDIEEQQHRPLPLPPPPLPPPPPFVVNSDAGNRCTPHPDVVACGEVGRVGNQSGAAACEIDPIYSQLECDEDNAAYSATASLAEHQRLSQQTGDTMHSVHNSIGKTIEDNTNSDDGEACLDVEEAFDEGEITDAVAVPLAVISAETHHSTGRKTGYNQVPLSTNASVQTRTIGKQMMQLPMPATNFVSSEHMTATNACTSEHNNTEPLQHPASDATALLPGQSVVMAVDESDVAMMESDTHSDEDPALLKVEEAFDDDEITNAMFCYRPSVDSCHHSNSEHQSDQNAVFLQASCNVENDHQEVGDNSMIPDNLAKAGQSVVTAVDVSDVAMMEGDTSSDEDPAYLKVEEAFDDDEITNAMSCYRPSVDSCHHSNSKHQSDQNVVFLQASGNVENDHQEVGDNYMIPDYEESRAFMSGKQPVDSEKPPVEDALNHHTAEDSADGFEVRDNNVTDHTGLAVSYASNIPGSSDSSCTSPDQCDRSNLGNLPTIPLDKEDYLSMPPELNGNEDNISALSPCSSSFGTASTAGYLRVNSSSSSDASSYQSLNQLAIASLDTDKTVLSTPYKNCSGIETPSSGMAENGATAAALSLRSDEGTPGYLKIGDSGRENSPFNSPYQSLNSQQLSEHEATTGLRAESPHLGPSSEDLETRDSAQLETAMTVNSGGGNLSEQLYEVSIEDTGVDWETADVCKSMHGASVADRDSQDGQSTLQPLGDSQGIYTFAYDTDYDTNSTSLSLTLSSELSGSTYSGIGGGLDNTDSNAINDELYQSIYSSVSNPVPGDELYEAIDPVLDGSSPYVARPQRPMSKAEKIDAEYKKCVENFTTGRWPCDVTKATKIAAFQACAEYGGVMTTSDKVIKGWVKECLPPYYSKEKAVLNMSAVHFKTLDEEKTPNQAKERYIRQCRQLATYNSVCFVVKTTSLLESLTQCIVAVSPKSVVLLNEQREVLETWPLKKLVSMVDSKSMLKLTFQDGSTLNMKTGESDDIQVVIKKNCGKLMGFRGAL